MQTLHRGEPAELVKRNIVSVDEARAQGGEQGQLQ
jgi:hypothetical protein